MGIEESFQLIKIVTDEEIKQALFAIDNEKAPGPDGYSSAFFKRYWGTVGQDLVCAVKEFFATGRLLKQSNNTLVALIPKTSANPSVRDFRPISYFNVVYKVIT